MKHYTKIPHEPKSSLLLRYQKRRVFLENQYNKESEESEQYKALRLGASKRGIFQEDMPLLYLANRQKVISHLKSLCQSHNLSDNTFFGAMYYLDIIMSKYSIGISLKKIHLIAVSCLIIALKFIQNDAYDIKLADFSNEHFHYTFDQEELRRFEIECVKLLNYDLKTVTVYDFVKAMINLGVIYNEEVREASLTKDFFNYAKELSETIVSSFELTWSAPAEMIAMGVIQFTRKHFGMDKSRMSDLIKRFKCYFDEDNYKDCCHKIKQE